VPSGPETVRTQVALVRAGARSEKGRLVERPKEAPEEDIDEVAA
jgi:hypothetical protein